MTILVVVIKIVIIDHSHDSGNYFNDDYNNNAIK